MGYSKIALQNVLGRTNRLLSFDIARTSEEIIRPISLLLLPVLTRSLPSKNRGIYVQTHRRKESIIKVWEMLKAMP
jgi:hypothetical protein